MSASALADEQGRKIFLGGLSFDAREEDLRTDFSKYGELEDVQLPMGDGGKHKRPAYTALRGEQKRAAAVLAATIANDTTALAWLRADVDDATTAALVRAST